MIQKNSVILILLIGALGIVFTFTSPESFSAPVFGLVFMLIYGALVALIVLGMQILKKVGVIKYGAWRMIKIAGLLTVLPVFMLLLHTIGQLTARDVLLAVVLFVLVYTYFTRMAPKPSSS